MRIEVVITVWENGEFKSRDMISGDNTHGIREEFDVAIDTIERRISERTERARQIAEDDDIPF